MPNPHKPFRMPENIQKTKQIRKCSGQASESRKRTNKKVRQNEKISESKTILDMRIKTYNQTSMIYLLPTIGFTWDKQLTGYYEIGIAFLHKWIVIEWK